MVVVTQVSEISLKRDFEGITNDPNEGKQSSMSNLAGEDRSKPRIVSCPNCSFEADCERRIDFHLNHFCIQDCQKAVGGLSQQDSSKPATWLQCQICPFKSRFGGKFKAHMFSQHSVDLVKSNEEKNHAVEVEINTKKLHDQLSPTNADPDTACPTRFCLHCSYATVHVGHLIKHLSTGHKEIKRIQETLNGTSVKFEGKEGRHIAFSVKRLEKSNKLESYKCKFCQFKTRGSTKFVNHLICNHSKPADEAGKEVPPQTDINVEAEQDLVMQSDASPLHKCADCEFKTVSERNFKMHKLQACPGIETMTLAVPVLNFANDSGLGQDSEQNDSKESQIDNPGAEKNEIKVNDDHGDDLSCIESQGEGDSEKAKVLNSTGILCNKCHCPFASLILLSKHYRTCSAHLRQPVEGLIPDPTMKPEMENLLKQDSKQP